MSCSKDNNEGEKGKNDKNELVVTGGVSEKADTYATVEGYINNTDDEGNVTVSVSEYGIEYQEEGSETVKKQSGKGLADNEYSVKLEKLSPNTNYQYRAYANVGTKAAPDYQYGKYKKFTTEKAEEAPNYEEDGITYEIKSESQKTAKVTNIDASVTDADILNTVTIKGQEYKVVELIEQVGKDHTNLKSVTLPSNLTTIGNQAFYLCENLKNLEIGENVSTIGELAFSKCNSLTNVEIPNKVKTLNRRAFQDCI